jgi:hypothetical protein
MKSKLVTVHKCLDCPYQSGVDKCDHPESPVYIGKSNERVDCRINNLDEIPDWCPLPDAKEEK